MSSLGRSDDGRPALLAAADRAELDRLVDADPIVNAVVRVRLDVTPSLEPHRLGGLLLGVRDRTNRLTGAALHGGNLLPIGGGPADWRALGAALADSSRVCSSVVGRVEAVEALWERLRGSWGTPRAIRDAQPLLVLDSAAQLPAGDPAVRPAAASDVERYLPAAAAMFTEELGISPYRHSAPADYRRRVAALIDAGRSYAIFDDDGSVVFKADLGAVSPHTCQLQGVWVRPDRRGQGVGTAALATVLREALRLAPTTSLYVNDFNEPARRMYQRLGFRQVATLATVLF